MDANYNRYSNTLSAKGLLWVGLLLICTTSPGRATDDAYCCPEGSTWSFSANCSDGSRIRLACSSGNYLIDLDETPSDNFTVVHKYGQSWLEFVNWEYERLSTDRFCVGRKPNGTMVALVCAETELAKDISVWEYILLISLGVSIVFLIATLAVYISLPELREIQDKAMMAVVTSLAVSYIILSIQNLRTQRDGDDALCISLAFVLYFCFMSVFFWLNIVSFNIWRAVWFKNFTIKDKPLFIIYSMFGWGAPMCFLAVSMAAHYVDGDHMKPGFGEVSCWFSGPVQTWAYFYGPIAILLVLNIIYLGLTSWRLWHQYRDYSGSRLRALRFKCLLYIKLIFVMGITWIFELLSFADTTRNICWILTDILNSLQGFIIFLLLVATRKRVRKLLAKKKFCGINFPKSWTAYEDEECEEALAEEVELSQHD